MSGLLPAPAFAGLTIVAPGEAGLAPDMGERIDEAVRTGRAPGIHAVLVARNGRLALERYFEGDDETWNQKLGRIAFGPETLHDLRSVTKSIVALVYGIALAQGKVPGPEAPLLAQFPEYPDLAADPGRARLTIGHVLTMTHGLEWNENLPYTDPRNSEIAMEMAADRYRFVLERPIVEEPGRRWVYGGGATALLGRLIAKGTGMELPDYARVVLFEPLGIARTGWLRGRDGTASAASGLRLNPRDLACIGQLVLDNGRWDGRQVVPADWIAQAMRPRVSIGDTMRYGYQWYLGELPAEAGPVASGQPVWTANGNGGQRLFIVPGLMLAVAILAGNYNKPNQSRPPLHVLHEVILPGVKAV